MCLIRRAITSRGLPTDSRRLTNDGHAILREIDVAHPAAKSMIELSRTQDEEVGDGTTSVIILGTSSCTCLLCSHPSKPNPTSLTSLAGEILAYSLPLLERHIHPVVIIKAFKSALNDALETIARISVPVDISSESEMMALIKTSIGTKFSSRWSDLMCSLALQAVRTVAVAAEVENGLNGASSPITTDASSKDTTNPSASSGSGSSASGSGVGTGSAGSTARSLNIKTVDIKRYARVEKVPGGEIEECRVLSGVMVNKDVTHPKMRRRIEKPRIVLLDCPLEYKKGESQTNIEIQKEEDWNRILQIEEEQIKNMCARIIEFKPDLVFTEKGVSGEWGLGCRYCCLGVWLGARVRNWGWDDEGGSRVLRERLDVDEEVTGGPLGVGAISINHTFPYSYLSIPTPFISLLLAQSPASPR